MTRKLIATFATSGHNLEYMHHLYLGALADRGTHYTFAMPKEFADRRHLMQWPGQDNVEIMLFERPDDTSRFLLANAWRCCRVLRRLILRSGAEEVMLMSLMDFMPFLPLFVPRGVRVSGIIYRIYLYLLDGMSVAQRAAEWLKHMSIARGGCIDRVFVLGDDESARRLNDIYGTHKYEGLPDPYVPVPERHIRDMRKELGIDTDKTIVLHLGSMTAGKGSDVIFDMIDNTGSKALEGYCFVFAGVVGESFRPVFMDRLEHSRKRATVIMREGFATYEEMASLVRTADKVVLPYRRVGQSSGIIGYCAQTGTPAYVPARGLIGRLVERYGIGVTVHDFHDMSSVETPAVATRRYCGQNTVEKFYRTILKGETWQQR